MSTNTQQQRQHHRLLIPPQRRSGKSRPPVGFISSFHSATPFHPSATASTSTSLLENSSHHSNRSSSNKSRVSQQQHQQQRQDRQPLSCTTTTSLSSFDETNNNNNLREGPLPSATSSKLSYFSPSSQGSVTTAASSVTSFSSTTYHGSEERDMIMASGSHETEATMEANEDDNQRNSDEEEEDNQEQQQEEEEEEEEENNDNQQEQNHDDNEADDDGDDNQEEDLPSSNGNDDDDDDKEDNGKNNSLVEDMDDEEEEEEKKEKDEIAETTVEDEAEPLENKEPDEPEQQPPPAEEKEPVEDEMGTSEEPVENGHGHNGEQEQDEEEETDETTQSAAAEEEEEEDDGEEEELGDVQPQLQAIQYAIVKPDAPRGPPYPPEDVAAFVAIGCKVVKNSPDYLQALDEYEEKGNLPAQGQGDELGLNDLKQMRHDIQDSVRYCDRHMEALESYIETEKHSTESNLEDFETLDPNSMKEEELMRHSEIMAEDKQAMQVAVAFYEENKDDPDNSADDFLQLVVRIETAMAKLEAAVNARAKSIDEEDLSDESEFEENQPEEEDEEEEEEEEEEDDDDDDEEKEENNNNNAAAPIAAGATAVSALISGGNDDRSHGGYDDENVDYGYEDADAGYEYGDDHENVDYGYEDVDNEDAEESEEEQQTPPQQQQQQQQAPTTDTEDDESQYPEHMTEFFEEVDCINDDIDVIKEATLAVASLNETAMRGTGNESDLALLEDQMGPLVETTNKQAERAKDSLSLLKQETKELDEGEVMLCHVYSDKDIRRRKIHVNKLSRTFIDEMNAFETAQETFKRGIARKRQSLSVARKNEQLQREMEQFYRDVGGIKDDVDAIENATVEIRGHTDGLAWRETTEKEETALHGKVGTLVEQTNKRATRAKASLSRLKDRTRELEEEKDGLAEEDLRTRKNVLNLQSRKFISAMEENQEAQRDFKTGVEEKQKEREEQLKREKELELEREREREREQAEARAAAAAAAEVNEVQMANEDDSSTSSAGMDFIYPQIPIVRRKREIFSPRVWWMVDLSPCYDNDEETQQQGATPLVRRCIQNYEWSPDHARRVLKAYRQFLEMKKELKDWYGTSEGFSVVPCPEVDKMWKEHIVDMDNYFLDCKLLVGHVLRYAVQPVTDDDRINADIESRRKVTAQKLKIKFGNRFDEELWGYDPSQKMGRFGSIRNFRKASSKRLLK